MSAAGCVVNDYADRKFDGHVKRTVNRPLPSGAVTEKEKRNPFVVLALLAFLLVLTPERHDGFLLSVAFWRWPRFYLYETLPPTAAGSQSWGAASRWSIPMAFAA